MPKISELHRGALVMRLQSKSRSSRGVLQAGRLTAVEADDNAGAKRVNFEDVPCPDRIGIDPARRIAESSRRGPLRDSYLRGHRFALRNLIDGGLGIAVERRAAE
jgi:hypothetical protein